MRFRIESTLGWMMLTGLGSELVPGVFKPELFPAPLMQGRRNGMARSAALIIDKGHVPRDEPRPQAVVTRTYDGRSSLWWLSWADDTRCAGIAIVAVEGEQSARAAMMEAERLDLVPAGCWECAGLQVPEEHRAEHEPFVGRFLTTAEAEAAFASRSIKSFEAEHGIELSGAELHDVLGLEVVE